MTNPPACERCGDPVDNKNAAGHYRDKCWECIEDVAYTPDNPTQSDNSAE